MAMYKITKECSLGEEHETNPILIGGLKFVKVAYTDNKKVADWYKERIGTISVEEVAE